MNQNKIDIIKKGFCILENYIEEKTILNWIDSLAKHTGEQISRYDLIHHKEKLNVDHSINPIFSDYVPLLNKIVDMSQNFNIIECSDSYLNNFENILGDIMDELYPNLKWTWINSNISLQLYIPNHFINSHEDGVDLNRLCVILIPLSNKPTGGMGGDLIIHSNNDKSVVESRIGNVVVLDFTKNNVIHELTRIENWIRTSLIIIVKK